MLGEAKDKGSLSVRSWPLAELWAKIWLKSLSAAEVLIMDARAVVAVGSLRSRAAGSPPAAKTLQIVVKPTVSGARGGGYSHEFQEAR